MDYLLSAVADAITRCSKENPGVTAFFLLIAFAVVVEGIAGVLRAFAWGIHGRKR